MSDLVTLTIDGTEVSVPSGTLVVDAAKKIGVESKSAESDKS